MIDPNLTKYCWHCEKRAVGCRTNCQVWKDYEKRYAEYRKTKEEEYRGNPNSDTFARNINHKLTEYKRRH